MLYIALPIGVGCLVKMNDRYGRPVVFCLGFTRRHDSDVFRNAPIQDCSSLSGEAANKWRLADRVGYETRETCRIVFSVSSLWLNNLQSLKHCREQWTGVTPSLVRKLNFYSKVG